MVTCKLWGRLGNQMFMIAAAIAYAKRHGLEYHIPAKTIDPHIWKTYYPHLFNTKYNKRLPVVNVCESEHSYQELPFNEAWRSCNIELSGYFQSEKYFCEYRDELLEAFGVVGYPTEWTSVHVRRGDYLKFKDKHPPLPIDYYQQAMGMMSHQRYLIFSDDIPWCKAFFDPKYCTFAEGNRETLDMLLMLHCKNNIIANSSFSWWAAWLNQNPDKTVIAPSTWFGPGNAHLDSKDIIPPSWVKV